MKVNFNLKAPQATGKTPLFVTVVYNTQRVRVHTNKSIDPKHWNTDTQKARQGLTGYSSFNKWLKDVDAFISQIETDWIDQHSKQSVIPLLPISVLKEKLRKYLSKENKQEREQNLQTSFWGNYDNFLFRMKNGTRVHLEKGTPMAPKTIFQFENLKRHLQNFEKKTNFKIEFENIDMNFYKKFVDYLTIKLNLTPNTIGKLITNLKVYMREALEDGLTTNNTFTHRKFKSINSKSDTVYLTIDEVKALQDLDLSKQPRYERVRDMFVIGCYTALRHSDLSKVKPENIANGMIDMVQTKTGKQVIIPMAKVVVDILAKYSNTLPGISNQKYNEYLYEVCKKCEVLAKEITIHEIKGGKKITNVKPKYEFVSSHTARRTFCTNEYRAGDLEISEIMALSGHTTEKSFYKYIRETPKGTAERIKEKFAARELKQATITNHLRAV
ncbi:MAG: site-specific integrase [Ferruginibacter sp.]